MTVNLNDQVMVTLRQKGRAMLLKHWDMQRHDAAHTLDIVYPGWRVEGGQIKMQLHVVMNTFGSQCMNGFDPPIETAIELLGR